MWTTAKQQHFFCKGGVGGGGGGVSFPHLEFNYVGLENQTSAVLELMFRSGPQWSRLFGSIITPWQHKTGYFPWIALSSWERIRIVLSLVGSQINKKWNFFGSKGKGGKDFNVGPVSQIIHIVWYNLKIMKKKIDRDSYLTDKREFKKTRILKSSKNVTHVHKYSETEVKLTLALCDKLSCYIWW